MGFTQILDEATRWARHKEKKQRERQEKQEHTREFSETKIEWQLPESMLPIRCVKSKQIKWSYLNEHPRWYINGSNSPQSFVYILKDIKDNEVLYVGLSDDPPRRHMEHRRNNKLGVPFKMIVVAVGDADTEREWIARCNADGCKLLNIALIKPK